MQSAGERFAVRAAAHDADDSFVQGNYTELTSMGAFAAAVPAELGGGAPAITNLRRCCAPWRTAADRPRWRCRCTRIWWPTQVWRWRRDPEAVETFLRRIVDEGLVLISTGASDWLNGTGKGGAGRRRVSGDRAKDFRQRRADGRLSDDRRGVR
jgi:hypothetical protein